MKMAYVGAISTSVVITIGIAMIVPAFLQHNIAGSIAKRPTPVMLSFDVLEAETTSQDVDDWCKVLALVLEEHDVPGALFLSGKMAKAHPECISSFSADIDIGSQTYSYAKLTSIDDYLQALKEVKEGKEAVDEAGKLDSKLFRAPYGSTDENIYSLLGRSNITADFSYKGQYNKYESGLFIRYDLITLNGTDYYSISSDRLELSEKPININFDNSMQPHDIDVVISELKSDYGGDIVFVNPSGLTGVDLTIREGESSS
jgi:peptidoglycan/xylan/chitin deacetylase (PgdA/CDA1 family)